VYGARGSVIAAISVSAPTVRTSRERLMQVAQQVVEEAHALSELIRLYHPEGVRGS
jgi:DNA-binding IclR family transcriptional regulator